MDGEGRHERGAAEGDGDGAEREEERRRFGFTERLTNAILGDEDDPLAAATRTMRGGGAEFSGGVNRQPPEVERVAELAETFAGHGLSGDPGDEQEHVDRQELHVETEERPMVYAPYGTLSDDALERLEEAGIDVQEVHDDGTVAAADDFERDTTLAELQDVAPDGTVRQLRVLEGGAVDLAPRRKVQAWIDLRFQYVSDHGYGMPDELEEGRLREIGQMVEKFMQMATANGACGIEGAAIPSIVGHVLDKPGDPFPPAS